MNGPARVVFLGSGPFAVPVADAVASHPSAELVAVVTAPPRRQGRGRLERATPVGEWAQARGLSILSPLRLRQPESVAAIAVLAPDLLVLADYGQIVPAEILALPPRGALNLHPSLLPRHRGAAPVQAAIAAGDEQTGVSLMLMDVGLDTGPIVAQREVQLSGHETAPELEARLAEAGAQLLDEMLEPWLLGRVEPVPQRVEGATLTRPLRREDGRLDPSQRAEVLERHVRAYQPWPGSFLETDGDRMRVWRAAPVASVERGAATPGALMPLLDRPGGAGLALVTADGLLELLEVQPSGGRRMSGAELLRGRPSLASGRIAAAP
ncbi:MAG TPA: methionyl-tRNA formyltransferase [Candidatus Caenarcaniphilales bacterium]|nr:methionyl-tRNA formyltransferase [Candidatus Caenarcaniphilales bacterium]